MKIDWRPAGLEQVPSPALLVDADRVRRNIGRMVETVRGEVSRLRPHLKTTKMAEVIRLQLEAGITKFKGATIAEIELAAQCGAPEVLLAYQPVGPHQERLERLRKKYPETRFSAIADDEGILRELSGRFRNDPLPVLIDVDCGMGRTGAAPERVPDLYRVAGELDGLDGKGLHLYDGHVHASDREERREEFERAVERAEACLQACRPELVVGGGSPSFPDHAVAREWECSPGTTLFWDAGYGENFPDLPYEPAAFLLTRVVSRPGADRVCLDLGHKAVAAENPLERRVRLLDLPEAVPVMQSEEHLVVTTPRADEFPVGAMVLALPIHVCPTVALHMEAAIVREGNVSGEAWKVAARDRRITV